MKKWEYKQGIIKEEQFMSKVKVVFKRSIILLFSIFLGYFTAIRTDLPYAILCVLNDGTLIILMMIMAAVLEKETRDIKISSIWIASVFSIGNIWVPKIQLFLQVGEHELDFIVYAISNTVVILIALFCMGMIFFYCCKKKTGKYVLTALLIGYWVYIFSQYAWAAEELGAICINMCILGSIIILLLRSKMDL